MIVAGHINVGLLTRLYADFRVSFHWNVQYLVWYVKTARSETDDRFARDILQEKVVVAHIMYIHACTYISIVTRSPKMNDLPGCCDHVGAFVRF